MSKITSYIIPIFTLIFFVFIMQGGLFWATSQQEKKDMLQYSSQIENDIINGHWEQARGNLKHLDLSFKKAVPKLQYHAEIDAIDSIKEDLARLGGYIDAEQMGSSLAELRELNEHWDNLKN
ncbi:MAG: DUF4363 family protein [Syntrophomonas sp.]|nr:DUF4363 family protein [Syntrophomonas sp.]